MKLAQALINRADAQKRIQQLRERLMRSARIQEGEKPPENPQELLEELRRVLEEFTDLVQGIRAIETMLTAKVDKDARVADLREMKNIFEKSVVTVVPIPAGAVITPSMVAVKKPGTGIPARRLSEVIGQRATRDIPQDTLLREEDLHA